MEATRHARSRGLAADLMYQGGDTLLPVAQDRRRRLRVRDRVQGASRGAGVRHEPGEEGASPAAATRSAASD